MCSWIQKICGKKDTPNTNLEQFISTSLIQICNGIRNAQKEITKIPYTSDEEKYYTPYIMPTPRGGQLIHEVQFDIAVTVSNTTSTTDSAKANIIVVPVSMNLGDEKTVNLSSASVSRIQFSIPIVYPSMPVPHNP